MTIIRNILTIIWFVLSGLLACHTSVAETLYFAMEDTLEFPTIMGNGGDILEQNPGLGIEANIEIEKRLGVTIISKRYPWKRCLNMLKKGRVDFIWLASYKKKREEIGRYPMKNGEVDPWRSFITKSYALYVKKDSNAFYDGKRYYNIIKVGAPLGFSIIEKLKNDGLKVFESTGTKIDFKQLLRGRTDAVAALSYTGDYYIKKNPEFNQGLKKIKPNLVSKPYYFICSHQFYKKNQKLAESIWDLVGELGRDKEFQKKINKYFD